MRINNNDKNKKRKNETDVATTTTKINQNNGMSQQSQQTTDTTTNPSNFNYPTQSNNFQNTEAYKILRDGYLNAQSNLNQQNQLANKYAQTTAQAQGFSTQGANQQVFSNLQNAYLNARSNESVNYQNLLSNMQNEASTKALSNFETELSNLQDYDIESIQKLINYHMPKMNEEDQNYAKYFIDKLEKANEPDLSTSKEIIDFSKDKTTSFNMQNPDKSDIERMFNKDIADQATDKKVKKVLTQFYNDMRNNLKSLEGKYFNMNYGKGKEKIYYVRGGKLYKLNSVPSSKKVINIKDYYAF